MPKRVRGSKVMRGHPITVEEFERLLMVTSKVAEDAPEDWKFFLRGLWASGLRISEALNLRWEDATDAIVVDLAGKYPMLRIPAEAEKGCRDRLLPITPHFAVLLESVAESQRRGRVFKVVPKRWDAGRMVAEIGKKAGVVVDEIQDRKETKRKFATAHDLRRSFGFRWSRKVMPTVSREMMRHSSLQTTMNYYVGQNAEATAAHLWQADLVDTSDAQKV